MVLIRQIILFVILICTTSYATAQDKQFTGSVLWKVSGNGLTKNSYIFGTNHMLQKKFLNRITELNGILDSCQQVVGEVDMNMDTIDLESLGKASLLPDGKTYSQLLNKAEYNKIDSALQADIKISLLQIETLHPVSIQTLYIMSLYSQITEDAGDLSENMDIYFQNYARAQG